MPNLPSHSSGFYIIYFTFFCVTYLHHAVSTTVSDYCHKAHHNQFTCNYTFLPLGVSAYAWSRIVINLCMSSHLTHKNSFINHTACTAYKCDPGLEAKRIMAQLVLYIDCYIVEVYVYISFVDKLKYSISWTICVDDCHGKIWRR